MIIIFLILVFPSIIFLMADFIHEQIFWMKRKNESKFWWSEAGQKRISASRRILMLGLMAQALWLIFLSFMCLKSAGY